MLQDSSGRVSFTSLVEAFIIHGLGPVSLRLLALTSLDITVKTSGEWTKINEGTENLFLLFDTPSVHIACGRLKVIVLTLKKVCWPFLLSNSFFAFSLPQQCSKFKQIGKKRLAAAARYCISLRSAIYWEGFAVNLSTTSASFRNATSFTIAGAQTPTLNSTDLIHRLGFIEVAPKARETLLHRYHQAVSLSTLLVHHVTPWIIWIILNWTKAPINGHK